MKLNNKGWGLGFLLIVGAIFLLILIVASIRINSLIRMSKEDNSRSSEIKKNNSDNTYQTYKILEEQMTSAGESYAVNHPTLLDYTDEYIIVFHSTLQNEGYIESLNDPKSDKNCDGYVMIKVDNEVKSFIKCSDYKTLNYDLWVED